MPEPLTRQTSDVRPHPVPAQLLVWRAESANWAMRLQVLPEDGGSPVGCDATRETPWCNIVLASSQTYVFRVLDTLGDTGGSSARVVVASDVTWVVAYARYVEPPIWESLRLDLGHAAPIEGVRFATTGRDVFLVNATAEDVFHAADVSLESIGQQGEPGSLGRTRRRCTFGDPIPSPLGTRIGASSHWPLAEGEYPFEVVRSASVHPPYRLRTNVMRIRARGTIVSHSMPEFAESELLRDAIVSSGPPAFYVMDVHPVEQPLETLAPWLEPEP